MKMAIRCFSYTNTQYYLELSLSFFTKKYMWSIKVKFWGKIKSKNRPDERSLDFSRVTLSPEHLINLTMGRNTYKLNFAKEVR